MTRLPSALVSQLQHGMGDFLRTSFWSSTPAFAELIENFIHERGALFQGPFVSLKLRAVPLSLTNGRQGHLLPTNALF
jgi:hypothetical protein